MMEGQGRIELDAIKRQLNSTWQFINEVGVMADFEKKGMTSINISPVLVEFANKLKDVYSMVEAYEEQKKQDMEESSEE